MFKSSLQHKILFVFLGFAVNKEKKNKKPTATAVMFRRADRKRKWE